MKETPAPQFRLNMPAIGATLAVAVTLVGATLVANLWGGIPTGDLTRDLSAVAGAPFYTGFISQVGLFFWAATAAICLFSARVVSRRPEGLPAGRFLLASGLLTLLLLLDDAFLLHEEVFPMIGIPEKAVIAAYGGMAGLYLVSFHRTILRTGYDLLVMAFFFLGMSAAVDVVNIAAIPFVLEDAAKITGITSWLAYFSCAAASALRSRVVDSEGARAGHSSASMQGSLVAGTSGVFKTARPVEPARPVKH